MPRHHGENAGEHSVDSSAAVCLSVDFKGRNQNSELHFGASISQQKIWQRLPNYVPCGDQPQTAFVMGNTHTHKIIILEQRQKKATKDPSIGLAATECQMTPLFLEMSLSIAIPHGYIWENSEAVRLPFMTCCHLAPPS